MKTKDALAIGIKLGRLQWTLDAWEESKHPRADNGQFSHSAGGGPTSQNAIAYAATGEIRPCPRCGSRDIEITVLDKGRRSITLVCRKCGSWRHFDGGK